MSEVLELNFHNVDYIITVNTHENETLDLEVEQKLTGDRWQGSFTARYIEEVTHQTGNFKKFSVFVKMLSTGLRQESDSVFVDLLTYQDLELLRSRQTRKPAGTSLQKQKNSNKRYLILTYAVEFDRVHYPLPLSFVDVPPTEALQATIRRLRNELEDTKKSNRNSDIDRLREENADLKNKLYSQGGGRRDDESESRSAQERDQLQRRIAALQRESDKEIARLKKECDSLANELDIKTEELDDVRKRLSSSDGRDYEKLRKQYRALEDELRDEREKAREEQAALRHELVSLTENLDKSKQTIIDLRAKVRELNADLELVKKRSLRASPAGDVLGGKRDLYSQPRATRSSRTPSPAARSSTSPSSSSRPFQRFDPTAYVRNKKTSPSPRVPSTTSSRASSRPSSVERTRPSPSNSRSSSVERSRPQPRSSSTERLRPSPSTGLRSNSPSNSTGDRTQARADRAKPWAVPVSSSGGKGKISSARGSVTKPPLSPRPSSGPAASSSSSRGYSNNAPTRSSPASTSSRTRQPVRSTSNPRRYSSGEDSDEIPRPVARRTPASPKNADNEITEIDARLNALQSFLKAAKNKAKAASNS